MLTPEQELIVVELRITVLLPTNDLLLLTREFINPASSRAGLGGCLRRHGVSDLRDLVKQDDSALVTKKTFTDNEPGFIHMDIKHLPSTCRICLTSPQDAICLLPSTAPRARYSSKSAKTKPKAIAPIF